MVNKHNNGITTKLEVPQHLSLYACCCLLIAIRFTHMWFLQVVNHSDDVPCIVYFQWTEHCLHLSHCRQSVYWHHVHHYKLSTRTFPAEQQSKWSLLVLQFYHHLYHVQIGTSNQNQRQVFLQDRRSAVIICGEIFVEFI